METKILEESKNRLVFEIIGEGHTLCNILRKELWNDGHVKAAAYNIEHPQMKEPRVIIETDGANPRKKLKDATKKNKKELEKLKKEIK